MRRSHLFLAAGVTVIAAVTVVLVAVNPDRHTAGTPSGAVTSIPGAGNTQLSAHVITPTGSGRHPLLIMPASWGATADEYLIVGTRFADEGYLVISYSQRGFGKSQGEIDFAGPQTRADVSAV